MRRRIFRWGRVGSWASVALAAVLVAVPAVATADAAADITWSVTPASVNGPDDRSVIEQEVDAGSSSQDFFAVRNLSQSEVTFRLSAADGYYTDAGRFNMLAADEESVDAGTWIAMPETVTVGAGATVVVPFTTTVPADAIPGDHAAGIAASVLSSGTDDGGAQVGVESRVGFRVLTRVTGEITPSVEIAAISTGYEMSWNPVRPGVATVTFDVRNTGNASVSVVGRVSAGTGSAAFPAPDEPQQLLLPGDSRSFTVTVGEVWPTLFVPASISLTPSATDFGGARIDMAPLASDATIWAVPIPQLLLILGLALVLLALLWGRRRSRRKFAEAITAAREEGMASAGARAHAGESAPLTRSALRSAERRDGDG
ncbi:hypothetical protein [Microbacterium hatanonis]|uniref:DUF916 domain-containing protein n=1 Tax=Microbacterium hatanonis TaxID=404366 RepID=A0A5C8HVM8_9MICO|nr:hypothetical protein [Microbacterium hatanonis]TXK10143.1 hypothetical protein FVP77_14895 [Microbacterium hatanonis]